MPTNGKSVPKGRIETVRQIVQAHMSEHMEPVLQKLLSDAPTAEELEEGRALTALARGSLWRRVAASTIRLELGDLAGQWVVLSVPNMHAIATYEFKSNAQLVLDELTKLSVARRRDLTRPFGTCPSCSSQLDG